MTILEFIANIEDYYYRYRQILQKVNEVEYIINIFIV